MRSLILLISLCIPLLGYSASFTEKMSAAQQSFTQKDYTGTTDLLIEALRQAETEQEKASAHNALGWTYFKQKQYSKAKRHLELALKMADEINDESLARKASNNLGVLAYYIGDYEKAQSQFSTEQSQQSVAASTYKQLIQQQQQSGEVNQLIAEGVSHRRQGSFDKAITAYDQALRFDPFNIRALEYKGYAQFRLGKYQQAAQTLNKAIRQDPNKTNILINLMKSLCAMNDNQGLNQLLSTHNHLAKSSRQTLLGDGELVKTCGKQRLLSMLPP